MCPSWIDGVRGEQVRPLIELDADVIRVEAGPGTGKTFGLIRRVERILHPDGLAVRGRDVLVVAFNRVIAKQLEAGILNRLKDFEHDGSPTIRTIHALCVQVIGEDLRILLPHERDAMIYYVLRTYPPIKAEYKDFDEAAQALRDHEARVKDHLALWQAVREWLTRHHGQLLSDLPALLLDRLKAGDLPELRFAHVIVDEFQDLTPGEQELMFRLRREDGQLVALGDPRQSIYRFRGNEAKGLDQLEHIGNGIPVRDIPMQQCQRCPAQIVIAANRLMTLSGAHELTPVVETPANIHIVVWESLGEEAAGMARAVVDNFKRNPTETHLVMATRRQFGYAFRNKVAELAPEVTVQLSFSESILESWAVREAFVFFSLMNDSDAATWRAWLGYRNSPTGKDFKAPERNSDAYLRLLASADDLITEQHIKDLAAESRTKKRGSGGAVLWDRAERYLYLKDHLKLEGGSAEEILNRVFNPDLWISAEYAEPEPARLDMGLLCSTAMSLLRENIERYPHRTAAEHLRHVTRRLRYSVGTREQFIEEMPTNIQVATLWGAKGVTADHVYMLGVCKEAIPGKRRREYPGTDAEFEAEQKRLFFVSITRTKKTLVLSRARQVSSIEARKLGLAIPDRVGLNVTLSMSPFVRDILPVLPGAVAGRDWPGCG